MQAFVERAVQAQQAATAQNTRSVSLLRQVRAECGVRSAECGVRADLLAYACAIGTMSVVNTSCWGWCGRCRAFCDSSLLSVVVVLSP